MSQFSIFRFIALSIMILGSGLANVSLGQNYQGQWEPPNQIQQNVDSRYVPSADIVERRHLVNRVTPQDASNSFAGVQQTNFEAFVPAANTAEGTNSSTGTGFSQIKDTIIAKTSGLIASFSSGVGQTESGSPNGSPNYTKMISSLALVLGGYFGFVWLMRKFSPSGNSQLPEEVVQVLGRTAVSPRQSLQMIRMGSKVLLLMNGPEGTHPIGEITDPNEVQQITALCSKGRKTGQSLFANKAIQQAQQLAQNSTPAIAAGISQAGQFAQTAAQTAAELDPTTQSLKTILRALEGATNTQQAQNSPRTNIFEA